MHILQEKILNIIKERPIKNGDFRQIGLLIKEGHPFKISYHIGRLVKNNFIYLGEDGLLHATVPGESNDSDIFSIPILGEANCGTPTIFAEQNFSGYIQISKKLLKNISNIKDIIVVKAFGNSMNKANINNKKIEEGDYVLVDLSKTHGTDKYVLATVNGFAVIKRLFKDDKICCLKSESSEKHPPIFVSPDELEDVFVSGYVLDVIKDFKDNENNKTELMEGD